MQKAIKQSTISALLSIFSMLLIFVIAGLFAVVVYTNLQVEKANHERYDLTYSANRFMNASAYLTSEVRSYVANNSQEHYDNYWNEVNNLKNRDIAVANMERIGITDDERHKIESMSDLSNNLVPLEDQAMKEVKNGDKSTAVELVFGDEYKSTIKQIRQLQTDFLSMLEKRTSDSVYKLEKEVVAYGIASVILVILLIIIQIISAVLTRKLIIKPIIMLKDDMNALSEGCFESNSLLKPDTSEIGNLVNSVNKVKETFGLLIHGLKTVSDELNAGDIDARIPEAVFKGEYKSAVKAINSIIDRYIEEVITILSAYGEFGNGNFDVVLKQYPGKKAIANEKFDVLKNYIKSVNNDLTSLISSAIDGQIDKRVNTSIYNGDWRKLMEGLNSLLHAINEPINEVDTIIDKLSDGDFDVNVSKHYKGSFAAMMNSFDRMINSTGSYIKEITEVLGAIADGDLRKSITREYVGQYDHIKKSINNIVSTLNMAMTNIQASTENVLSSARQMSDSAMSIANGANSQASTVKELNSSVLLINEHTLKTAEDAQSANDISHSSIISAKDGSEDMNDMLASMEEIKEASHNISKVIKVIDEIAFQTNLLALNAAVEAARAGEQGKGFAVVASEVRSLSVRSSQSAQDTSILIEDAIRKINAGTAKAVATSESLNKIVSNINAVSGIIEQIHIATKDQRQNVSYMTAGLNQISQVAQVNSSTSEESAAAAQELNSMAIMLNDLVRRFRLK